MNIYTLTGEVLLKGTNEAIEELRRLEEQAESTANKLGTLISNMDANFKASSNITTNSLSKVSNSAKTFESDFTKTMNKVGKTLLAVFSAREIIGFAKDVTEASAEVTAEIVAFEQILGEYADTAKAKMEEMARPAGIVSTRLTPHMTNLTAKFKGLGFEMNEATDLAIRGLEMATDAAAFWDKSLEQSMEHLKSFINGNYEGGEAIGLFANETQMAYYGIEKGLIASRKAWIHLDEATKQATRLEFAERMFRQAEITGHAARESEHFANVLANLKESFRQLKASIGDSYLSDLLIPAMDSLRGIFDDINENVDEFNAWLEDNEAIKHFSELWTKVAIDAGISLSQIKYQFERFNHWLVNDSPLSPIIKPIVEWGSAFMENIVKALEGEIGWDEVFPEETPLPIKLLAEFASDTIKALEEGNWAKLTNNVLKVVSLKVGLSLLEGTALTLVESIGSGIASILGVGKLGKVGLAATGSGTGLAVLGAVSLGIILTELADEGFKWEKTGADILAGVVAGLGVAALGVNPFVAGLTIPIVASTKIGRTIVDWARRENEEVNGTEKKIKYSYNAKPVVFEFNTKDMEDFQIIYDSFARTSQYAESGIDDVIDALEHLSTNVAPSVQNILSEIFTELKIPNLDNITEEQAQLVMDILNTEFNQSLQFDFPKMVESATELGENVAEGFEKGVDSVSANIIGEHFAENFLGGSRHTLEVKSPSKATEKLGNYVLQGFELGLDGTNALGEKVGNDLLRGMQDSLEIHSPSEKTILLASFLLDGFELGLRTIEDLGSDAGQKLILGMYDLIKDDRAFEIGELIGEAINEGLISKLDAVTLTEWVNHILNNPPSVDEDDSGGTPTPEGETRKNRYNYLSALLEDKEGELEAAITDLYNARADFGNDSQEAIEAGWNVSFLEQWIANLKELIAEIENPSIEEDNTFFGKIKQFIDNTQVKIDESKEKYGEYIDFIEEMFSEASDYLKDLSNGISDYYINTSKSSVAQLERDNKIELEKLEEQLRNKEICHAEYYQKKEELENDLLKEQNDLEEKKFNAEKVNSISDVWTNLASGTMKIWSEYATMPWLAGSLTAILGGTAIAQTAAIAAQKYVPMLAQGGIVDSATHAIIGEDGREAVVPLERNLEWVDGLAKAMSPAVASSGIYSYTPELSSIRSEIVEFRRMVAEYFPQVIEKDTQLSIDGRVLSNALAPMMDKSLGSISRLKARGV